MCVLPLKGAVRVCVGDRILQHVRVAPHGSGSCVRAGDRLWSMSVWCLSVGLAATEAQNKNLGSVSMAPAAEMEVALCLPSPEELLSEQELTLQMASCTPLLSPLEQQLTAAAWWWTV